MGWDGLERYEKDSTIAIKFVQTGGTSVLNSNHEDYSMTVEETVLREFWKPTERDSVTRFFLWKQLALTPDKGAEHCWDTVLFPDDRDTWIPSKLRDIKWYWRVKQIIQYSYILRSINDTAECWVTMTGGSPFEGSVIPYNKQTKNRNEKSQVTQALISGYVTGLLYWGCFWFFFIFPLY